MFVSGSLCQFHDLQLRLLTTALTSHSHHVRVPPPRCWPLAPMRAPVLHARCAPNTRRLPPRRSPGALATRRRPAGHEGPRAGARHEGPQQCQAVLRRLLRGAQVGCYMSPLTAGKGVSTFSAPRTQSTSRWVGYATTLTRSARDNCTTYLMNGACHNALLYRNSSPISPTVRRCTSSWRTVTSSFVRDLSQ